MQRIFSFILIFMTSAFSLAAHAIETYQFDPNHTYILWHINHFGFSIQAGKFTLITGKINLDQTTPANSKVTVNVDMNNIVTGLPKLDEHLKSPNFFDVTKFPTATFISNKVVVTGPNTGKVYGILTLHGIQQPVILDMKLLKIGLHPMVNKKSIGFSGTTHIKRSDFGMETYLPNLGDDIDIEIGAEANLSS